MLKKTGSPDGLKKKKNSYTSLIAALPHPPVGVTGRNRANVKLPMIVTIQWGLHSATT